MKTPRFLIAFFCLLAPLASDAGLLYTYNQLALRDLDEMSQLVQQKIKESRQSSGHVVVPLKEALQAVFARPNEDFMIEKILSSIRNELDEHQAYEESLRDLTTEALGALKNPKPFGAPVQVTYAVFLENLISEVRPRASEPFENGLLVQIRDAKIEITKQAKNERRLGMMKEVKSPSDLAAVVLKDLAEAEAARKKAAEEASKAEEKRKKEEEKQKK